MMASTSPIVGGLLLVAAGVFQFTPLKQACLGRCRSPMGFLLSEWRGGRWGALTMGLKHGAYCVGCCWALMALLFVAGVMNLLWVAPIAVFVLLEKTAPMGEMLGRITGAALVVAGIALLVG
jgi:predicted metal-binding membrane protein